MKISIEKIIRIMIEYSKPLQAMGFSLLLTASFSQAFALDVTHFVSSSDTIARFEKFEIRFVLDAQFENPFDPEQVDIEAVFTGPEGKVSRVFGFFARDFEVEEKDVQFSMDGEKWRRWRLRRYLPRGEGFWAARFTPSTEGRYGYYLRIRTPDSELRYPRTGQLEFTCLPGKSPGFLKPDAGNPRYLRFDDGTSYFGVGINGVNTMGAYNQGNVRSFEVMAKSAEFGGNIMQIDLCEGDNLEWGLNSKRGFPYFSGYEGLNRYNLQVAAQIDSAVRMAEELGVYLRFTFYHFVDFKEEFDEYTKIPGFSANPYCQSNGGPCAKPGDFFTSPEAWKYQEKLFRYVTARWGYSPHILCWELWNEVDFIHSAHIRDIGRWHARALETLRKMDPNHMVTTSFAKTETGYRIFERVDFDLITFHCYPNFFYQRPGETIGNMVYFTELMKPLKKPIIAGEFGSIASDGIGPMLEMEDDAEGIHLHNQLWASLMLGHASSAMHWHWEIYIDKFNLYHRLKGIANFVKGEDFGGFRYFGSEKVRVKSGEKVIRYVDTFIPTPEQKAAGTRGRVFYAHETVSEAEAMGLVSPQRALVWVYDQGNNYISGNPSPEVRGAKLTVEGMEDGPALIEYWDTVEGTIVQRDSSQVKGKSITVNVRPFKGDTALKIIRI